MIAKPESSLTKREVYKSKRIRLTSPALHIGSESQRLSPFEYVATDQFVYFPDINALTQALYARGKRYLDEYINRVERRQGIVSLLEDALGSDWQQAISPDGRVIFPKNRRSLIETAQPISDLRPIIRNGFGQIYIPGSSIKGAIRTAIAYRLLLKSKTFNVEPKARVSEIEKYLKTKFQKYDKLDNPRKSRDNPFSEYQKKRMDDSFMKQLFQNYEINAGQKVFGRFGDANRDFMRAVYVTDSTPLLYESKQSDNNCSIVAEVIVVSRNEKWKAKYRTPIYTEIATNIVTEFTLTLDEEMLEWFQHKEGMQIPFKNIDELLQICADFAQAQWECELDYWESIQNNSNAHYKGETISLDFGELRDAFYNDEDCPYNLRIGWASGLPGTTIHLLFEDDLAMGLRDRCHSRNPAPGFEAPKSRRVIANRDRQIICAPGWIKFEPI